MMRMMVKIKEQFSLAEMTTIKLGGLARFFVEVTNLDELREALMFAQERSVPVHVLGGGSNTIFVDEGYDGLVVQIKFKGLEITEEGKILRVRAQAGEEWDDVVKQVVKSGGVGMECLSGIPGTVGATPIQNVGAYGQEVSEIIDEVEGVNIETLKLEKFSKKQCEFAYRTSRFKERDAGRYVITQVVFRCTRGGQPTVTYPQLIEVLPEQPSLVDVRRTVLGLRQGKSMVVRGDDPNSRSCGSFFMNVVLTKSRAEEAEKCWRANGGSGEMIMFSIGDGKVKIPAAWLIEQSGFEKGERRGGVGISENHFLALINYAGTTQELLNFSDEISQAVLDKFGVLLEREPVVVR